MKTPISNVKRLFFFALILALRFYPQISPHEIFPVKELLPKLDAINADTLRTVSFTVVGDIMCHSTQFEYARTDDGKFDFNPVYTYVKKILSESDFTLGNLETVTAGKELDYKGYPEFNSPDEFTEALAEAGFDVLFTANNHALDQGEIGVRRTIEIIGENGMKSVGSGKKDSSRFLLLKKNGIVFALLAYSYGTNGFTLPDSSEYRVNVITRKTLRRDLAKANSFNPDFIMVYFHYGTEYSREPDAFQLDYTRYAFRYGADIVIGSHPHAVQTVENKRGKRIEESFAAYSLGNFVSNQRWRYSDCGVMLKFTVAKNFLRNTVEVENLSYLPFWVYKGTVDSTGKQGYRIYALSDTLTAKPSPFFTDEDLRNMNQSFRDTKEIIEKGNAKIEIYEIGEKRFVERKNFVNKTD